MPDSAVKQLICDICGAEVRDGSLYCYNCGGSVSQAGVYSLVEPRAEDNGLSAKAYPDSPSRSDRQSSRRRRSTRGRSNEVVWEPKTGISIGFIVGSLIFVLIAVVLLLIANYLK